MNVYTYRFTATCPNNGEPINYTLKLTTARTIMVEEIKKECAKIRAGFHEDIAEKIRDRFKFAALQLFANHHGVDIATTLRPKL